MADIIKFSDFKGRKLLPLSSDINDLIGRAVLVCRKEFSLEGGVSFVGKEDLKNFFEKRISQEIFSKKMIEGRVFLCGIYISNLLANFAFNVPESWWAIDYFDLDNPSITQKGGDICFLICSVFPERCNGHRINKISYYREMGENFYYRFYGTTKKEIGCYMSQFFSVMAEITRCCMKKI